MRGGLPVITDFFPINLQKSAFYTEMITTDAIINSPQQERLLGFDISEKTLAIQLDGSSVSDLAQAARIIGPYRNSEINLNVSCPIDIECNHNRLMVL